MASKTFGADEPGALVTVYRRKVFVEMAVVPVEGLDAARLKRRALSLRGCRASELGRWSGWRGVWRGRRGRNRKGQEIDRKHLVTAERRC